MFQKKNKMTEEKVKALIDAEIKKVRYEYGHYVNVLSQRNYELEQMIIQMRNEYQTLIQNHIENIEAKIWSFSKVWNPVMQGNIDRIKVEINADIEQKLEKAVQKILDMERIKLPSISEEIKNDIDKRIGKLSYQYQEKMVEMDEKIYTAIQLLNVNNSKLMNNSIRNI